MVPFTMSSMTGLSEALRRRLAHERVARFATLGADGPALVPICFALGPRTLYHVLDAKPKRVEVRALRRVRNLARDPRAAAIIDHYEEDWGRLWFVALEGTARLLTDGAEHRRALAALRRKYAQYRRITLSPNPIVIALDVLTVRRWRARPPAASRRAARVAGAARRSGSIRSHSPGRHSGR